MELQPPSTVEALSELFFERDLITAEYRKRIKLFDDMIDTTFSHIYEAIYEMHPHLTPDNIQWASPYLFEHEGRQVIRIDGLHVEVDDVEDDTVQPIAVVVPMESMSWSKEDTIKFFQTNSYNGDGELTNTSNVTGGPSAEMDFDQAMEYWTALESTRKG